jgi:hypothetical protein
LAVAVLVVHITQILLLPHLVLVAGGSVLVVWVKMGLLILVVVVLGAEILARPVTAVPVLL